MTGDSTQYVGAENLEVMALAENYNRHLTALVTAEFRSQTPLLDFGAGTGTFSKRLRDLGYSVACVELDSTFRATLAAEGFEIYTKLAEVPDLSVAGACTLNVLEHIEDDVGVLKVLFRKMRPGGKVFVYVPAFPVLYSAMDEAIGHYRRYTRRSLTELLQAGGFEVRMCRYHDSVGFFAALFYRWFGDRAGRIDAGSVRAYDRFLFPLSVALDRVCGRLIGKNVSAVALRRADT